MLPRLIKERRPDARVAVFWHIPWPNPEAFGICPWQRELLDGLLGADIVGFHIQGHCRNFLQTIDRALECRIEWERFAVNRRGHSTLVSRYPNQRRVSGKQRGPEHRAAVGGAARCARGLGVERPASSASASTASTTRRASSSASAAIERFLEKYPAYCERFTLRADWAPSRTEIERYHDLVVEVQAEAERINQRFQVGGWKPISCSTSITTAARSGRYYQAADFCMVTSLHDGMNLVAKEFVAHRDDEDGVLVLSQFAGACCELRDAVLVNPYDTEQLAEAIRGGDRDAGRRAA